MPPGTLKKESERMKKYLTARIESVECSISKGGKVRRMVGSGSRAIKYCYSDKPEVLSQRYKG
ncbi:hypothetical protein FDG95_gp424 [Pectobacterium phage vB_PcaM_CBB]|uniref:Uncharacterized protein n=1 Tax=Pectobacterium phage vB_PcaM_CBB TaxID=2772511 RepID=A0A1L2CVS4_9CAUD|nr:hypothetical protein FDG95_gp002 [Pectobacterium phage vB_PcaM_CBB]YP_009595095.1 hypothetical protein FDG95_gp424 [Pectobacterium phage vB_PcaM_CBB]AMM43567.1 hypothetical protein CBB_2 [Pectobacterium phage vB_PcaM_CBB]AMM44118.1 hypothetical protein CBB_555 [Pectobacterium phage vB_PcaM_CBB]